MIGKLWKWRIKICEYLNGEGLGYRKEYFSREEIKFEGEYLNDIRWVGNRFDV